jgi:hypothetical protein
MSMRFFPCCRAENAMNRYLEDLQGLNFAAIRRGFQEGPRALGRATRVACLAARSAMHEQLSQIPVVPLTDLLGD